MSYPPPGGVKGHRPILSVSLFPRFTAGGESVQKTLRITVTLPITRIASTSPKNPLERGTGDKTRTAAQRRPRKMFGKLKPVLFILGIALVAIFISNKVGFVGKLTGQSTGA